MSAGSFVPSRYRTRQGQTLRCKVQPETEQFVIGGTIFNAPVADPVDCPGSANMRGSRRQNGVTARTVSLRTPGAGSEPAGYKPDSILAVPILDPDVYDAINLDDTVTYLGVDMRVVGKTGESIR